MEMEAPSDGLLSEFNSLWNSSGYVGMLPGALLALLENFTPVTILASSRLTAPGSPRMAFTRHSGFASTTSLLKKFERDAAKRTEGSRKYDRLMEHIVYTGL